MSVFGWTGGSARKNAKYSLGLIKYQNIKTQCKTNLEAKCVKNFL